MHTRQAIFYALVVALATGAFAATAHIPSFGGSHKPDVAQGAPGPFHWAPDWLMKPLKRALADAVDPRERDKETGAPKT